MKKLIYAVLIACMLVSLASCSKKTEDAVVGFKPVLDKETSCNITVVGNYDNFEALEAEFDRFNEYYPNVRLKYLKLDDYNNTLAATLESSNKPNIFFSYASMVGNRNFDSVFSHMENLSDPALKLDLNSIRPGLVNHDANGSVMMVPVFSRSYGMLVNYDLFEKEGLSVPTTMDELLAVCAEFKKRGYFSPMMGYSLKSSSCLMYTIAYPMFVASIAGNPQALELANALDPAAGEYMRTALEAVQKLRDNGCFDLGECDKIGDNYTKVILRFFEGDVPMMICAGDTVSGTKKRESQSEAFSKSPFKYAFAPIPLTDKGGFFLDSPSVEFSVNKDCDNLDMTNEFMRFLITKTELNEMASKKRLVTPTTDLSFDSVYAPFAQVPADRTFSPEVLGILDPLTAQIRNAAFKVGRGELTIDEVISMYGSMK